MPNADGAFASSHYEERSAVTLEYFDNPSGSKRRTVAELNSI